VGVLGGGPSIQLARIAGIRIGASPSWFFVLFVLIYLLTGYFGDVVEGSDTQAFGLAVAAALLFFASITLHELGHALVARRNGIGITGIDLFFFGGIAKLTREAETPGAEFRIAAAGPAVTALVVGLCLGIGLLLSQAGDVIGVASFDGDESTTPVYALLGWLALINVVLLVFNLVPAFPLDGGRIARAAAWKLTGDRNKGTRISGRAGQVFAGLMMAFGVYLLMEGDQLNGIYTVVLAFFLFQAASGAVLSSAFSDRLGNITVADVMDAEPVAVPATTQALAAEEEFFLRYREPFFPVVDERGRYLGVLRRERVEEAVAGGRPATTAGELIEDDPDNVRVGRDQPLESLLGQTGLRELGALMAVDAEGVLCGVVTGERIRRALTAAAPGSQ
jgi:Zn-dependent protease